MSSAYASCTFFAKDRKFPRVKSGDLLAVMSVCIRVRYVFQLQHAPRVPEVLVKGGEFRVVRKRRPTKC
jgi:hypothetical protein